MSDNRRYYYLKLKESFFDENAIVLLESMQDGILYSNILFKLYLKSLNLKSLKNSGKLQLDEHIPYNEQMIATLTRQQVGTVERVLQIFRTLGIVEPLSGGTLYMSNIELSVSPLPRGNGNAGQGWLYRNKKSFRERGRTQERRQEKGTGNGTKAYQ